MSSTEYQLTSKASRLTRALWMIFFGTAGIGLPWFVGRDLTEPVSTYRADALDCRDCVGDSAELVKRSDIAATIRALERARSRSQYIVAMMRETRMYSVVVVRADGTRSNPSPFFFSAIGVTPCFGKGGVDFGIEEKCIEPTLSYRHSSKSWLYFGGQSE